MGERGCQQNPYLGLLKDWEYKGQSERLQGLVPGEKKKSQLRRIKKKAKRFPWLKICLPMLGTQVLSLVWEDSTCGHGAAKPWPTAPALEPRSHRCWRLHSRARAPQEKPTPHSKEEPLLATTAENPHGSEDPGQPEHINNRRKRLFKKRKKTWLVTNCSVYWDMTRWKHVCKGDHAEQVLLTTVWGSAVCSYPAPSFSKAEHPARPAHRSRSCWAASQRAACLCGSLRQLCLQPVTAALSTCGARSPAAGRRGLLSPPSQEDAVGGGGSRAWVWRQCLSVGVNKRRWGVGSQLCPGLEADGTWPALCSCVDTLPPLLLMKVNSETLAVVRCSGGQHRCNKWIPHSPWCKLCAPLRTVHHNCLVKSATRPVRPVGHSFDQCPSFPHWRQPLQSPIPGAVHSSWWTIAHEFFAWKLSRPLSASIASSAHSMCTKA